MTIYSDKLTIIAFCCNQEDLIKNQINDLSFADEIIFIDLKSTDKTVALAKHLNAKVIANNSEKSNKELQQSAISEARNNWILLLNLNEKIAPELVQEIQSLISKPIKESVYFVKQTLFFFGKEIKYGEIYSKKRVFIFDKSEHNIDKNFEVSQLKICTVKRVLLKNRIKSYAYQNFEDYNNQLADIRKKEAISLFNKNKKPTFYHFLLKPFFCFVNQYFFKFGLVDGKEGYILAYINSFSVLKRYLILYLLYKNMD